MNYHRRMLLVFLVVMMILYECEGSLSSEGEIDVSHLVLDYYGEKCPLAEEIVVRVVAIAVLKDPRMAASLLRLHFHDCFVMGCDASLLLDDFGGIISEKNAGPNLNSLRGFEVIDEIKLLLEEACPCTVSCADILAIAARDSVALRGGPRWEVYLGRKDSLTASFTGANVFIPAPNFTLEALIQNFHQQGLDITDLVALSGAHTIGKARCLSFKQRLYDQDFEQFTFNYREKNPIFLRILRSVCPEFDRDQKVTPLDYVTPTQFDNNYYHNIIRGEGLLETDNVLITQDLEGEIKEHVWKYALDEKYFFSSFANSMIKMGNIHVLTGEEGQIRKNCRFVNI